MRYKGLETQQDVDAYLSKPWFSGNQKKDYQDADAGLESSLQKKIVKWAKDRGYPCLSLKQSKQARGYILAGWPDVTLALPGNRTVWIELKGKTGVLRDSQKAIALQLMSLGHEWHECRSWKHFIQIMEGDK